MTIVRTLLLSLLTLGSGCANASVAPAAHPVRVLDSESARAPVPELDAAEKQRGATNAPRIGAPGGSGAGARRVAPAQSGKETVGGLPAGIGGGSGPAGRG